MQQTQSQLSSLIRLMIGSEDLAKMLVDIMAARRDSALLFCTLAAKFTIKSKMSSISQTHSPPGTHMHLIFTSSLLTSSAN